MEEQVLNAAETEKWSGIPVAPKDFSWEKKSGVLCQIYTRNFYNSFEVYSALEKSICQGKIDESLYWAVEYGQMGRQFYDRIWNLLFTLPSY